MKKEQMKILVLIISIILLVSSAACNTQSESASSTHSESASSMTSSATLEPTPKKLSRQEKISFAEDYVIENKNELIKRVKWVADNDVTKISNLDISSAEVFSNTVTLKGNFYGLDDYGTVVGRYIFEWRITIERDWADRLYARSQKPSVSKK